MVQPDTLGARSLTEALRETTVAITSPGFHGGGPGVVGTGFFAAPDLVVTCAHVVPHHTQVSGIWQDQQLTLDVVRTLPHKDGSGPDLALLRPCDAPRSPSWACLGGAYREDDSLWGWGYPKTAYRGGDALSFRTVGDSVHRHGADMIKVAGVQVFGGHSGSPVLNLRTGGVIGMLRGKEPREGDSDAHHAARLIPTSAVLAAFPEVAKAQREAVTTNAAWLDRLTDAQIRAGGWHHPGPLLRDYLKAALKAADEHPYSTLWERLSEDGGAIPPLTRVYLHQHVGRVPRVRQRGEDLRSPPAARPAQDTNSRPLPRAADVLVSSVFTDAEQTAYSSDVRPGIDGVQLGPLPAEQALAGSRHALVLGGPGSGKSSLLRRLTTLAAGAWLTGQPAAHVPVLVPADILAEESTFPAALAHAANRELRMWDDVRLPAEVFETYAIADVPWLVLVDGVDEIIDQTTRRRVLQALIERGGKKHYRIVIASRFLPSRELDTLLESEQLGVEAYEIQPFDVDQLPAFAQSWFESLGSIEPAALTSQFIDDLRGNKLDHLTRIPLLATMLCAVYAHDPEHILPSARAELYEAFIGLLGAKQYGRTDVYRQLPQRLRRQAGAAGEQAAEDLLRQERPLLDALAAGRRTDASAGLLDMAEELTESLRPAHLDVLHWRQALRELLRQSGVLVERGSRGFSFIHRTIEEYLAACHLAIEVPVSSPRGRTLAALGIEPDSESFVVFLLARWQRLGQDLVPTLVDVLDRHDLAAAGLLMAALRDGISLTAFLTNRATALLKGTVQNRTTRQDVRLWAAVRLAHHDLAAGAQALGQLIDSRVLDDEHLAQALLALVELDQGRTIGLLKSLALTQTNSPTHTVRLWLLDQLAALGDVHEQEVLRKLTADPRTARITRAWAAGRLADLDPQRGHDALMALLTDHKTAGGTRLWLTEHLAGHSWPHAPAVLEMLTTDPSVEGFTRVRAARLLADHEPSQACKALQAMTTDTALHAPARRQAAAALAGFEPPLGTAALLALAQDPDIVTIDRIKAAESLSRHDRPSATQVLHSLTRSAGIRPADLWRARELLSALGATPVLGPVWSCDLGGPGSGESGPLE
ncbi:trypsin-like peptidase domain-containing protein [Streptomyces sp. NPDC059582]|uniref:trypsin-like peptidase domain-containing protein n=1 Tax=Streptomyces sp. NPDC059582 TaxID=3346875 RepID=UPI0036BEF2E8